MGRLRPVATLFAAAACTGLLQTPGARAHDSLAPPGALHTWLPKEGWVKRHWLPFDERQLTTRLDIRDRELEGYLYDDHRPLADLAIARDDSPGSCFSAPLTKLDAIYFTLGTLSTAGTGDLAAVSEQCRAIVSAQLVAGFVVVTIAVAGLVGRLLSDPR